MQVSSHLTQAVQPPSRYSLWTAQCGILRPSALFRHNQRPSVIYAHKLKAFLTTNNRLLVAPCRPPWHVMRRTRLPYSLTCLLLPIYQHWCMMVDAAWRYKTLLQSLITTKALQLPVSRVPDSGAAPDAVQQYQESNNKPDN